MVCLWGNYGTLIRCKHITLHYIKDGAFGVIMLVS